jgi:hypothetical protein
MRLCERERPERWEQRSNMCKVNKAEQHLVDHSVEYCRVFCYSRRCLLFHKKVLCGKVKEREWTVEFIKTHPE